MASTVRNYTLTGPTGTADADIAVVFNYCERTNTVSVAYLDTHECFRRPNSFGGDRCFARYQGRSVEFGRRQYRKLLNRGYTLTKETVSTY